MQTLPKVGDTTTIAGISFPLTVVSYDPNTLLANLKGEHPVTGVEVLLPKVCLSLLRDPNECPYAIGQFARLKSHGPLMTVVEVHPPLPFTPEGTGTKLVCHYFNDGELCEFEGDARTLYTSDKRCRV